MTYSDLTDHRTAPRLLAPIVSFLHVDAVVSTAKSPDASSFIGAVLTAAKCGIPLGAPRRPHSVGDDDAESHIFRERPRADDSGVARVDNRS